MSRFDNTRREPFRLVEDFSLFDLETVRLVLRGISVLDWQLLRIPRPEIKAFLRVQRLDPGDPDDSALIERVRDEAVRYLRETLLFPVPQPFRRASLNDLLEMARDTGNRHRQFCACILLKVMHTINHFDAGEARQALAMTDQELFQAAERRIYRTVSQMMADGLPVVEFLGGRKQRASMLTKLLSKSTPLSAQLFDKMRFRVITTSVDDILPVISYLVRNLFPFNYVLSGESYNTLLPFGTYCGERQHLAALLSELHVNPIEENDMQPLGHNQHSSPNYKVVHLVADMPVRIPSFRTAFRTDGINPIPRPVLYVRTELQIVDRRAHRRNERSDASHTQYKQRQITSVATRLKLGSGKPSQPLES